MLRRRQTYAAWFLTVVALTACSRTEGTRFADPRERFSMAATRFSIHFPPLERTRDEFLTLVVNMEGMEGLIELVRRSSGVDVAAEDLFERSGLSPSFPPALFEYRGASVLVLGVADPSRLTRHVEDLAAQGGWTARETPTDGPALHELGENLAWAVQDNLAVFLLAGEGRPLPRLAALLLEPRPEGGGPWPQDGAVRFTVSRPDVPLEERLGDRVGDLGALSGLARSLVRFLDSCERFEGTVVPGDRYRFEVAARGCTLPFGGPTTLTPEDRLPDDTVLLVRSSMADGSLWGLLSPTWQTVLRLGWRELVGKKAETLPDIGSLLDRFEPEIALAFLGLSPEASAETFSGTSKKGWFAGPLAGLHLGLLLRLKEGAAAEEILDDALASALVQEVESSDIGSGDISAVEHCKEIKKVGRACLAVIVQGRDVALVTGPGEGLRLVRTLQGQRESLGATLFAQRSDGALTVTLKTRRLVQDLMNKGFPPYFLAVLSSVLEVRLAAGNQGSDALFRWEVVLR